MKKLCTTVFFCTSFFAYAAESPRLTVESPRNALSGVRTKDLGDTGAEAIPKSALSGHKKTSVGHTMRRMSSPERVKHPDFSAIENVVNDGSKWRPGRRIGDVTPPTSPRS